MARSASPANEGADSNRSAAVTVHTNPWAPESDVQNVPVPSSTSVCFIIVSFGLMFCNFMWFQSIA